MTSLGSLLISDPHQFTERTGSFFELCTRIRKGPFGFTLLFCQRTHDLPAGDSSAVFRILFFDGHRIVDAAGVQTHDIVLRC